MITVSFTKCNECGHIKNVADLVKDIDEKLICQDTVDCAKNKLSPQTSRRSSVVKPLK